MSKVYLIALSVAVIMSGSNSVRAQAKPEWRTTVYLASGYIDLQKLNVNNPVDLKKIDKKWFILTGNGYMVDLLSRTVMVQFLTDIGYIDVTRKGIFGPVLGMNKVVENFEVKLFSWHTVYLTDVGADGKYYEALYGLISRDGGKTYEWEALIPLRIAVR